MMDGVLKSKVLASCVFSYHEDFLFYVLNFIQEFLFVFSVMTEPNGGQGGGRVSVFGGWVRLFYFFTFVVILLRTEAGQPFRTSSSPLLCNSITFFQHPTVPNVLATNVPPAAYRYLYKKCSKIIRALHSDQRIPVPCRVPSSSLPHKSNTQT